METKTTQYEFSHGRKPRGRGLWLFDIAGKTFSHNGAYGEAKKAALKFARENKTGAPFITVLP